MSKKPPRDELERFRILSEEFPTQAERARFFPPPIVTKLELKFGLNPGISLTWSIAHIELVRCYRAVRRRLSLKPKASCDPR